ncbi:MAG: sensor histidine kinase [Ignavibacteria bacterium]|jgi:signal transduction histidine kinase
MWYNFLVLSFILWFSTSSLAEELDSLKTLLKITDGIERIDLLNKIANQSKYVSTDSVLNYAQAALRLAEESHYLNGQSTACANIAFFYVYRGVKDSAFFFINKALEIDSISGDKNKQAQNRLFLGNVSMQFEDYEKASDSFLKALHYFEEIKDTFYIAKISGHLGIVFGSLNDYDSSLKFFNKGLAQYRAMKDSLGATMTLTNLGYLNLMLKNYKEAISYFNESLAFYEGKKYNNNLSILYSNMGECYIALGDNDNALRYLILAQKYLDKNRALTEQAYIYNHIAAIYINTGKFEKGKQYLQLAIDVAGKLEHKTELVTTYKLFHDYYLNKSDVEKAKVYFDKYVSLKDSLISEERHKQVAELETKYETEKKEKENAILRTNLEVEKNKKALQQRLIWFISIAGLLLIALAFYFNRSLKQKNLILKKENEIKEAEKEIVKQETIANQQEEFSRALLEKQEEERERIAGELHDSIGQELLIVKNKILSNKENENPLLNEVSDILSTSIDSLSNISHNLSPLELAELEFTETVSMMINRVSNSSNIKFSYTAEDVDTCLNEKKQINLFRILQEAINNIIKHSNAQTASLSITKHNEELLITVKDDGIGFDINTLTANSGRPHFGLSGIKERVKLLNGEFIINSKPNKGTELELRIPYHKFNNV